MAQYFSPRIVTNGLVSYHDFFNNKCYPGSGTASYDLAGSNTTTFSGPTYTNGFVNFNGSTDFIAYGNVALGNTFTIHTFVKHNTAGGEGALFGLDANGADNWFSVNSNKVYVYATQIADVNNFGTIGNTTLASNVWYGLAMSINTSTVKVYVNGRLDGTNSVAFTIGGWTSSYSALGRRGSIAQRYFNGSMGSMSLYNRVLSDDEILRVFETGKNRYGI